MNTREFLEMLHVAERLKDTTRHCTTTKGRPESVAEHSFRISLMAMWLKGEFPDCNMDRVIQMCLIHDLGECFTGDIPVFKKTEADRIHEEACLDEWVSTLPEAVRVQMQDLYREMDAQETMESKIYKAMDKLEAVIQHNESPLDTWEEHEYDLQRNYGWEAVEFSDWLTQLRKDILEDTERKISNENHG